MSYCYHILLFYGQTQALYASQAISGVDYEPVTSGTFLIRDGESEGFAQVTILNDTLPEQDETFGVGIVLKRKEYCW